MTSQIALVGAQKDEGHWMGQGWAGLLMLVQAHSRMSQLKLCCEATLPALLLAALWLGRGGGTWAHGKATAWVAASVAGRDGGRKDKCHDSEGYGK